MVYNPDKQSWFDLVIWVVLNIKMNYQNLKFAQISILTAVSIYAASPVLFITTAGLALWNSSRYYITAIVGPLCALLPFLTQLQALQLQYLLPCLAMVVLCLLEQRQVWQHGLSRQQKMTIFLIFLGLTTLNGTTLTSRVQLSLFYFVLILKVLQFHKAVAVMVTALRVLLALEAVMVSLVAWFLASWGAEEVANRNWWYFAAFPLAILYSSLLEGKGGIVRASESQLTSESKEIEMQDLSQRSLSKGDEPEAERAQMQGKIRDEQIQKDMEQNLENNGKQSYEMMNGQEGEQSQSLNLFLVIPFCLLQQGWIEIPIYAYLIALAWGSSRRWLLSLVLISAAVISANCQVAMEVEAALRVLAVLLVTKNLQGGYEIGEILKTIWLRSSFALVLSVLFWFALLTVNIFHLLFIAIILLFITKGTAEKTQHTHSFRHRNWKYLLSLFDLFLLLRLLLTILSGTEWRVDERWKEVLQLTGISFHYVASPDLFNAIPLFINAIMGLQFLTYNSKIYSKHTQSTLFQNYRAILANVIDVLTVIYYKLLPWVSYLAIICLLLVLEPSLGGCVLLAWILLTLGTHVLLKNEPSTYRRLFWLWILYSRLTSLQIVLRYVFQFMKFDLLAFVRNVRVFEVLLQYQEFLGLAIRDQDTVYLKTVTKFQLMISLDLMAIFIAFLVTEYYSLLLKFSELPPAPEWGTEERRVQQLYHNYVDFKLISWLQGRQVYKVIRIFCNSFFELYFPLLGLACCQHITLLNFLYLCLLLRYFLALNYAYYRSFVLSRFGWAVLAIVLNWSRQKSTLQLQDLNVRLRGVGQDMAACKVDKHNRLRFGFVVVTVAAVLLTYFSGMLRDIELLSLLEGESVLRIRWWLLVSGCSKQCGLVGHFPKLMLVLLVLQMKCCWFVNKFQLAARNHPEHEEDDTIVREVLTVGEGIQDEDRNESAYLHQMEGRDIQSSVLGEAPSEQRQVGEMQVSLLLGSLKLLQRSLVMVLVFISIVLGSHPFGIVYLLCAICLNYLGSVSVNVLSKALSVLLLLEYLLCLSNYSNSHLFPPTALEFSVFQQETMLHWLLGLPAEWEWYLTFGKGKREMGMLGLSWVLLAGYQLYFVALRKAWLMILSLVEVEVHVGKIGRRMSEHLRQVYEYGLTYSPLVVMLLCLFIYLLDYTTTNMLLTALTVGFIFVSFLVREYRESRHFWRTYFVVLQLLIVCFMLIYSLLQLPMLATFCTRLLCAPEELHTQIYKALLLLILQIGLDLTSSHHFDRALRQFDHQARRLDLQKLSLAYHHNDRKIMEKFKQIKKQRELTETVTRVQQFLHDCKENPQLQFERKQQEGDSSESWYNFILEFLPSLIDQHLLLSEHAAARIVAEENATWIKLKDIKDLTSSSITDLYIDDYGELEGEELEQQLRVAIANSLDQSSLKEIELQELERGDQKQGEEQAFSSRKSFAEESLRGVSSHAMVESMRQSVQNAQENKQLLYLLLVESVLSNWHYLTYFALVMLHVSNQGLLTLPIPAVVFCMGVVASYQAGKQVWRALLLLVQLPLLFKFAVSVSLLNPSQGVIYLLVGDNMESVFWEYTCIVFIIGQCVILKMVGHYKETAEEVECMKMALVRNLLNHRRPEDREQLFGLLKGSGSMPGSLWDMLFGKSEGKPGYDYSTLLTGMQLLVLVWVFLFYDRMAVRQQVTFYQMIEYNQFSSGMVALTLCQLFFLLVERFVAIVNLRGFSSRWEPALVIKYVLLVLNLLLVEGVVLVYFPLSSGQFAGNVYVTILLVLNMLALLIQSLQIKQGLDQASRGFMDRYTWYNGFIYIGFRAIPFLFQFKAFSDWTFTRTALRIFDWIRLQEIFGRLYVAKCNALFLAGKQLGSKIEWWKKLLMGYPLLFSIILLLFGPLVLFSSLNPLASRNDVTAGYLQMVLRINKTNQYPLYTNSHITDIHRLDPSADEQRLLALYDIDPDTVQQLQLEEFSDQYWEISEGSYYKLLSEPEDSLYELLVRAKFDRNETGLSSLYVLNTYELPADKVPGFKQTLLGKSDFCAAGLLPTFLRLDNNNGLHQLGEESADACLKCTAGVRATKQYWVLEGGLRLRVASDKYTRAIFGYSVMSFYISIILVIANYFRFLFQGTVHTIITSDIPHPDPALALCNAIYTARRDCDLIREEELFWSLIDLLRSPDTLKALTGNYLQARLDTLKKEEQKSIKND